MKAFGRSLLATAASTATLLAAPAFAAEVRLMTGPQRRLATARRPAQGIGKGRAGMTVQALPGPASPTAPLTRKERPSGVGNSIRRGTPSPASRL